MGLSRVNFCGIADTGIRNYVRIKKDLSKAFPLREAIGIFSIMMTSLFLLTLILDISPFQSDESVYVYSAYAITKGVVPYRGIFLAHPPLMYLVYSVFIQIVGANFISLRLCNVVVYLFTIFLTYIIAKLLLEKHQSGGVFALLSAALYAFYPSYFLFISATSLLENLLTLFTLSSVVAYIQYHRIGKKTCLFFAGFFMSLALLSSFRAILFVISIILFILLHDLWHRKYKSIFAQIGTISFGMLFPVLTAVFLILYFQALPQFYLQTFYYHTVLFPESMDTRLNNLYWYINSMFPLVITGILGALYLGRNAKKHDTPLLFLPLFLAGVFYSTILYIFRNTFFHYFYYMNPYLVFLSVTCFLQIKSVLWKNDTFKVKIHPKFTLLTVFLALLLLTGSQSFNYLLNETGPYFRRTTYNNLHLYLGNYIANITNPDDKIWTSEGAIAFFAQRVIQAPNSSNWPFQALFSNPLGYSFGEYRGDEMKDYKEGFVTTDQFVSAWEIGKVKVLVFILGTGWIPYPDELLWNGFRGQEGVANYVQEKYDLRLMVTAPQVSYVYYVWMRK